MNRLLLSTLAAAAFVVLAGPVQAADPVRDQDIYGYQLMTPEERAAHRTKLRSAKTYEERERIRKEHHTAMQIRAKEKGMTLPDEPPAGRGPGSGPGGGGMGPGGGRR